MASFVPATLVKRAQETPDSLRIELKVPDDVAAQFSYHQGQHLPVRAEIDGKRIRRTYSICSTVDERTLRLGVRVQEGGRFSQYLANSLQPGDTLEVMPPKGHFFTELDPQRSRRYAAFAAGSGITPILSIVGTTLETEPDSRFVVFYGNRTRNSTMFADDLWNLKNRFPDRLSLHFVMSREPADIDLYSGRIDAEKTAALYTAFLAGSPPDEVFVCGPDSMIDEVTTALNEAGIEASHIHTERFRAARKAPPAPAVDQPKAGTEVLVTMDGQQQRFHMAPGAGTLLDAAREAGLDLPFSCKGGVCSTCRT
ncbi:MAG: FAD-binding oxidoreductase, partial [Pseudomonadota bacterium]